ncbi:NAD(P)-dependent dehydrogenase, short-chain alcohol dehydrogenase family [Paenibacillus sp. UNCCL117]|uniref:SDR family oxidoreductase n=1 Tax=unclassified Paenibacillus TaxID=185978 RepID=UPI000884DC67|nr:MULTISPECIES: SDR family oxidoreductase [unclassified Paenibacillus]SDD31191.1 NAD(P)-dependent dehydrogenase, short-chain alcohol dehydrogenase family [Paenibacillus sp. cl123]SFW40177.1 NAD(P)-dependent dehydrogenase, short-chain alcohol dehydrogenase family [Paenibacillus sp. UNCCL117]
MSTSTKDKKQTVPPQHQDRQPGLESEMTPKPVAVDRSYKGSGKLQGKVAIITGGDSGIGRAAAVCYAAEGANLAIVYLDEHEDAKETKRLIEEQGGECLLIAGDIGEASFCEEVVKQTVDKFGRLDILVNNAAEQHPQQSLEDISQEQLEKTFRTNIFSMFYLTKAALPLLKEGSAIINTTSVTAYRGHPELLDYASTKGAIVAFTRSLSQNVIEKGIRVNAVAPGPIWTPLIPSTFDAKKTSEHGAAAPMKRPGQPEELGPAYVFLASDDSSYMAGQVLHLNGGEIING